MAALTLTRQPNAELSLQQHLDLAPHLVQYGHPIPEGQPEPLMMAQSVPHQSTPDMPQPTTEKKRVKVYELRNNDWFDRGTGFCVATMVTVRGAHHLARFLLSISCRTPIAGTRARD